MRSKRQHWCLWGTLCLLCSCIDGTYDLKNKEVSLDVGIEGNKIVLPLGNLKPILLDSMLSTDDQEMLKEIDGVYSIAHSGVISPIGVELDEISFKLDEVSYSEKFNFEEAAADINGVTMPGKRKEVKFNVTDVSIEDINEKLPRLQKSVTLDVLHAENIAKLGTFQVVEYVNSVFTTNESDIPVEFEYLLPKEVKNLDEIQVINKENSSKRSNEGAVFHFKISHPHILREMKRSITFRISFPESFDVALYPEAEYIDKYQLSDHVLTVTDMPVEGDVSLVEFYFNGFKDIQADSYYTSGVHEDGTEGRQFVMNENISYSFDYHIDGNLTVNAEATIEDFQLGIELDAQLGLYDVIGETNPIEFDFDDEEIPFSPTIPGLKHIKEVKYVRLDPQASQVRLTIDMPETFEPFELMHGESFKIHLPEFLFLNEQLTALPEGMEYDADSHTIYVLKDDALDEAHIVLALDSISINQKVVDESITMSGSARLTTGGAVYFVAERASLRNDLPALRDKVILFDLEETHFVVEEVVVVSDAITKDLHKVVDITIDEPIEKGLDKIYSIDFKEDVTLNLAFDLKGLDDVQEAINMRVDAMLPSFICLETSDPDVEINDGHLRIDTKYTPGSAFKKSIKVTKLDFTKMADGYLGSTIVDEKTYLKYVDSIAIDATVSVDQMEVSSDILNRTVEVDFDFVVTPITVGVVEGVYSGEIGAMNESFDLNLGEQLDFLKEEGNGLTLSDPQIKIALENTLSVPLNLDVAIIGLDEMGEIIETAHIVLNDLKIAPAIYDEEAGTITPDSTKYFFVAHEGQALKGYTTVVVPELATLLQKLPSAVSLEIVPKVDTSVTHRVDLYQEMHVSGDYSVVVPLKFDELEVCYTDTISGLELDMAEITEIFSHLGFSVYMDVNNTLPIGLSLELTPINTRGKELKGIVIDPVSIKAGEGGSVTTSGDFESLKINAQSEDNADLNELDGLIFTISTKANETLGGAAIKPEQGIHVKNIVIELRGDINVDLNELNNNTEE
ncbi:MAG: hypothetical protein II269_04295 [Bacteroidaceae bacterium]|nr:hypothetical protein [Bacteroidaceae bacterium]